MSARSAVMRGGRGLAEGRPGSSCRGKPRFVLLTALLAASCAPPRPVQTALSGDLQELRRELSGDPSSAWTPSMLQDTARAVLRRELATASEQELPQRLAQLDPCATQVAPLLDEMVTPPALRALHVIVYAQTQLDKDLRSAFTQRKQDEDATQALVTKVLRATGNARAHVRQSALLHPELSVRIAGALSSWLARDVGDVLSLADAARRDPAPAVRVLAMQALGRVPSESAVRALLELSPEEEEEQLARLSALAGQGTSARGGLDALARLMYRGQGDELQAALVLYARAEGDLQQRAARQLLRSLEASGTTQLMAALRLTPGDVPGALKRFEELAQHEEALLAVLALSRVAQQRSLTPEERKRLQELASAKQKEEVPALLAQALLALQGEPQAAEQLSRELTSKHAQHRSLAALALLQSSAEKKAQLALADDSPAVRTQVACAVLARSEPQASSQATASPSPVPEQLGYLRWLPPVPPAVVEQLAAQRSGASG